METLFSYSHRKHLPFVLCIDHCKRKNAFYNLTMMVKANKLRIDRVDI